MLQVFYAKRNKKKWKKQKEKIAKNSFFSQVFPFKSKKKKEGFYDLNNK